MSASNIRLLCLALVSIGLLYFFLPWLSASAASPDIESLSEVAEGQRHRQCLPFTEQERLGGHCRNLHDISAPERQQIERLDMRLQEDGRDVTASGFSDITGYFRDIVVLPSGELVVVGGRGLKVARSDADARHWTLDSYSGFADGLLGVAMGPDGRGYAVGQNGGVIFETRNGGRDWEPFNRVFDDLNDAQVEALNVPMGLFDVAFADADTAVAVGYESLLRTIDDGLDWHRIELPIDMDDVNLQEVVFTGPDRGWTVGSGGTVLRTDDAGADWQAVDIGAEDAHLTTVAFVDPDHGCIGGGLSVWCTRDGGGTWQATKLTLPRPVAYEPDVGVFRLRFLDANQAWLITQDGLVYRSKDGGDSWTLWLDLTRPGREDSAGVMLAGLALGNGRAWVVGSGTLKPGPDADPRWDTRRSPIMLSWPLDP
ncbi:YCF48-related protein [Salinisphaera sp. T31B1]|uniref:WD40/YVTN/BNR-like repeat-containing protein n=1 Tax=Salinisphaera sp. T31B1 TaxID=727963 RepID=UPI00333EE4A3